MNDSLEDRVYALVEGELGVKRETLTPNSTLSHDLGMEGDDAVEFFERFAKEFNVDTRQLGEDWHAYFSPEGAGLGTLLCVFVPPGVFAAVLSLVFPSLPLWLWGITGIVGWLAAIYYWQKTHPGPQISVQDLVECARAGIWKKELPGSIRVRLSKYRRYGLIRWFIS
jgi:hypothetical protein